MKTLSDLLPEWFYFAETGGTYYNKNEPEAV